MANKIIRTCPFPQDFINNVTSAKVVSSPFGYQVEFLLVSGGTSSLPLYDDTFVNVGDSVDLKEAELLTLDLGNGETSSAISIISCNYDIEMTAKSNSNKNKSVDISKDNSEKEPYSQIKNREIYCGIRHHEIVLKDYKKKWRVRKNILYFLYILTILSFLTFGFLLRIGFVKTAVVLVLIIMICVCIHNFIDNKIKAKYESLKKQELFKYGNEISKLEDKIIEEGLKMR